MMRALHACTPQRLRSLEEIRAGMLALEQEHGKALARVTTAVLRDGTKLFKQFSDNEGFRKKGLTDTVFALTYDNSGSPARAVCALARSGAAGPGADSADERQLPGARRWRPYPSAARSTTPATRGRS